MTRISNVRKSTKFKRSIKAISPVIATLLMIAIAVVASLVVYAWVNGYIGGSTTKAGNAIQIQSFAVDAAGDLHVYVQNVGQGTVQLGAVYVNDDLKSSPNNVLAEGNTVDLVVTGPYDANTKLDIKVTTTGGTFMTASGKPTTGGTAGPGTQYQITVTQTAHGTIAPGTSSYDAGSTPSFTITPDSGYHIASVTTNAGSQALASPYVFPALSADGTLTATFAANTVPLALDGSISSSVTSGNTITLTLVTSNANDVLYLSWVGNGGNRRITDVSSSGTSSWTQRARISADNNHWLETWYATRTTAGTTTITITMNNDNGDCAAVAYGISGADTSSPFDGNRRTNTGFNDGSGSVTISTSNANDFILGAIGVDNTPTLTTGSGLTLIRTQTVGGSRETSGEYRIVSTTQTNLAVGYSFSSTEDWAMVVEAIKKAP